MTVNITSPITGAAQTGLTSPTYTNVSMAGPDANVKQVAVTALGGTQTGVDVHSVARPFTISYWWPKVLRVLPSLSSNGQLASVPMNVYKVITRKGVTPLVGQPSKTMLITTSIEVPAGADTADAPNVRAALSAHIGTLSQQSAGIGDTGVSGVA
ncbi:coat protein [ssRNA phage SRR5466337_1]|uniref:Coat protein n=1 Tax=ssRNA phage SRR5466337_1 TaxID=2786387 RepID=A0A8S5L4U7_9VIRU|nr:coat protein [ssRNA phage SRR5466337_1]DAD52359.1 TPA_asm: coat protein [ssRNA phage SRR5466337_1]